MDALHAATTLSDLNMPGWSVHPLKGNREGRHAWPSVALGASRSAGMAKAPTSWLWSSITERKATTVAKTKTTKVLPVRQPLKREPTHPGEILREDVLPALRMNVSQAARELGVSRQLLHRILAGSAPVTPEMAVRLGKWAGNGPALWLGMQQAFDVWHAEQALGAELERIPGHAA